MPCYASAKKFYRYPALMLLGLLLFSARLPAAGFEIQGIETQTVDGVYVLDSWANFDFSEPVWKAIQSGVPVTVYLEITVQREREYLWNEKLAELHQEFRLEFHALSGHYLVRNLNSGVTRTFRDRDQAVTEMGIIQSLPIIDEHLVLAGESHYITLQARLDVESLPAPLRVRGYLDPKWRVDSGVYRWPLTR